MNRFVQLVSISALALMIVGCGAAATPAPAAITPAPSQTLTLATTTSTQDSGLLDVLIPVFEKQYNVKVKVIAVGTGQALKLGQDGNADVVLVHARSQEDALVAAGDGIHRRDVMYNDFIVVGPKSDPAKIAGVKIAADAFRQSAEAQALFVSRGDKSGTNTKELDLWKVANVEPKGAWYFSVGQGMGETLVFANEKNAYTLSDRATWLAQSAKLPSLTIVVGGSKIEENADKMLLNPYGVIPVNPAKHPNVNADLAEKFASWLTSLDTQKLIAQFGVAQFGQPLFRPDSAEWKKANPQQ